MELKEIIQVVKLHCLDRSNNQQEEVEQCRVTKRKLHKIRLGLPEEESK